MIVITCDNSKDRGQILRTMCPPFTVDIATLQPKERWNDFYRNDSIADLIRGELKVMPRIPAVWKGVSVNGYPVSAWCAGKRATAAYDYLLNRSGGRLLLDLSKELLTDVRLGPFSSARFRASVNGRAVPVETISSAAGYWAWV